jgi:hypothetical protein
MKTIKREIELFGIELEIVLFYSTTFSECPSCTQEYDIMCIYHKGENIYELVSNIKDFKKKIIDKLSENEND